MLESEPQSYEKVETFVEELCCKKLSIVKVIQFWENNTQETNGSSSRKNNTSLQVCLSREIETSWTIDKYKAIQVITAKDGWDHSDSILLCQEWHPYER